MSANIAVAPCAALEAGNGSIGKESSTMQPTVNKKTSSKSMDDLPNEILSQILGFLDVPRIVSVDLLNEPRLDLTQSESAPIKAASCVAKRWRQAASPILFKHARYIVLESDGDRTALDELIEPFLEFAKQTSLRKILESFTLVVQYDGEIRGSGKDPLDRFSPFWMTLFDVLDPQELLIVAPAEALGALAACHVALEESWFFDCNCHYLQLKQPKASLKSSLDVADKSMRAQKELENRIRESNETGDFGSAGRSSRSTVFNDVEDYDAAESTFSEDAPPRALRSSLLQGRPWSKLLLNEGSSVRAYASYEWWLREPPSILSDLVGADVNNQAPLISPTVRDMSYIGIFPLSHHFNCLVLNLPRLDRLYTQFVPRNEILQDPARMSQVEATDLWTERNQSYAHLMQQLFNVPPIKNYRFLGEFESGDAADREAWNMAVAYVERAGRGWKVASDGVFVRDPAILASEPDDGEEPSLLSV